ncbi:hypothetical protein [uncultured Stenotrophomonas sp.]|uniref:hypothetical protein n=1 Tax=uncultured Stenotrophomonas sp. TaxID=165438 RepID=UPI0028E347C7|nr:hypothetical protein [uncultured Stenotrophomonas sp.]
MATEQNAQGDFVATLIHDSDYARQTGQVATVWTGQIRFVRRKELAMQPYALEIIPMAKIQAITYKATYALVPAILGVLCIAAFLTVMFAPMAAGTRVPIGALMLAAGAGFLWLRGIKRHVIEFSLGDTSVRWRSRAGEFKDRDVVVKKVLAFARDAGLLR